MDKPTKRIAWNHAYKLMNRVDADGKAVPFDIRFCTRGGDVVECHGVQRCVSYDSRTGMRRLVLANGEFRNIYDVLILQVNATKIIVS